MIGDFVHATRSDERVQWALLFLALLTVAWCFATETAAAEIEATHLRERGITTTATIVRAEMRSAAVGYPAATTVDYQVLTVRFADQTGRPAQGRYPYDYGSRAPARVGETAQIIYDPIDPSQVRRLAADYRHDRAFWCAVMAAILLCLAGVAANQALDRAPENAWKRWRQSRSRDR